MRLCWMITTLFFCSWVHGGEIENAPDLKNPSLVPVDIIETQAKMVVDASLTNITVDVTTTFRTEQDGKPVFFLRMDIDELLVDGLKTRSVATAIFEEENSTSYIDQNLTAGRHELKIKGRFTRMPGHFNQWIPIDYIAGDFIEKALPANFMYDFYKLKIEFDLSEQPDLKIMSNGVVQKNPSKPNHWILSFSSRFNSSFFFMDLIPFDTKVETIKLRSLSGKDVEFEIYLQNPTLKKLGQLFVDQVKEAFVELEEKLGPYPYEKITFKVLNNNRGGAFAGALMFDRSYASDRWIVHELSHSWYLKGISPVNGYDGWFHEGFAEWARYGFPRANKAINPIYARALKFRPRSDRQKFPSESWDKGRIVLSHLDKLLEPNGGLLPYMEKLHRDQKGTAVSTQEFFEYLTDETGADLEPFFRHYFR
ncbi:MAG: hypothetical protein AAF203_01540 [Pseudomonadota bacterium]